MKKIHLVLGFALLLSITWLGAGCTTTKSFSAVPASYETREPISEPLFSADNALMSHEDIARALDGKVVLPQKVHVTILPSTESMFGHRRLCSAYESADEASVDAMLSQLGACGRVERVSLLPSMMLPNVVSIAQLREVSARYQADLLLVYRVSDRSYSDFRLLSKDRSKLYAYVEAILLDVRTGIVPFSSAGTEIIDVAETKADITYGETMDRVSREAAGKALLRITNDLIQYLSTAPSA